MHPPYIYAELFPRSRLDLFDFARMLATLKFYEDEDFNKLAKCYVILKGSLWYGIYGTFSFFFLV